MRSILNQGHNGGPHGTAHVLHVSSGAREDPDAGFERPPPKGTPELFNPKVGRRSGSSGKASPQTNQGEKEKERVRLDVSMATTLATKVASMSLEGQQDGTPVPSESPVAVLST